jgi:hypothetical protein
MNPSFAMAQWIAREEEEQIRRDADRRNFFGAPALQPALPVRFAGVLRTLANRLDPQRPCLAEQ